jgi:hypothetical protein
VQAHSDGIIKASDNEEYSEMERACGFHSSKWIGKFNAIGWLAGSLIYGLILSFKQRAKFIIDPIFRVNKHRVFRNENENCKPKTDHPIFFKRSDILLKRSDEFFFNETNAFAVNIYKPAIIMRGMYAVAPLSTDSLQYFPNPTNRVPEFVAEPLIVFGRVVIPQVIIFVELGRI